MFYNNTRQFGRILFSIALLSTFAFITAPPCTEAAELADGWQQIGDEGGIKVYRRAVTGSKLFEFRGIGTVNASIPKMIAIMADFKYLPEWVYGCRKGELVAKNFDEEELDRKSDDYHEILYGINDLPWPLEPRDYILKAHVEFVQPTKNDSFKVILVMNSITHPNYPQREKMVRMVKMSSTIVLTPIKGDESKTRVDFAVTTDPAGNIPAWVTNLAAREIPSKTLLSLRQFVNKTEYNFKLEKLVQHHYDKSKNINSAAAATARPLTP
jgi:hypothetical protein